MKRVCFAACGLVGFSFLAGTSGAGELKPTPLPDVGALKPKAKADGIQWLPVFDLAKAFSLPKKPSASYLVTPSAILRPEASLSFMHPIAVGTCLASCLPEPKAATAFIDNLKKGDTSSGLLSKSAVLQILRKSHKRTIVTDCVVTSMAKDQAYKVKGPVGERVVSQPNPGSFHIMSKYDVGANKVDGEMFVGLSDSGSMWQFHGCQIHEFK